MQRHTYFDLLLHDDSELETLLHSPVMERTTLHEWPLSCVQRLLLADGQTWIYKAESGPTVEAEFYAASHSRLLPRVRSLYRDERYSCLLVEDLQGERLDTLTLDLAEALEIGYELLHGIAAIGGCPPVYLDVSTWERWQALMVGMLDDLKGLVAARKFHVTQPTDLENLARAAVSLSLRDIYLRGEIGLVHHDLNADNVFVTPDGYKVIDWQRPIRGPVDIDRVLLLTSLGFDPRQFMFPGIILATDLLRAHWLVECSLGWFPPGIPTYDQAIAGIARNLDPGR